MVPIDGKMAPSRDTGGRDSQATFVSPLDDVIVAQFSAAKDPLFEFRKESKEKK